MKEPTADLKVALIGIGSVLMGDDAAGPHFVRTFEAVWEPRDGLSVLDLGTPGPELSNYLMGLNAVLVVDAIRTTGAPGEIHIYQKAEILAHDFGSGRSAHDPSLHSALQAAELAGKAPELVSLVGVIPARVELHTGLSTTIRLAMPGIERAVLRVLASWGIEPTRRLERREPELWWLDSGLSKQPLR